MRRPLNAALGVALFVAGCQAGAPTRPVASSAGPAATPAAAPSQAAGRATPAPTGTQAPRPTGTAPLKLDPAPAGTTRLAGQVRLDAGYALRAGAGSQLIGLDGSTLIGLDGSTLKDGQLLDRGGRVVAAEGSRFAVPAGLIGLDGSTLIGNDGSTLIGLDGSTMVAAGGGNLVAAGGGNLIGNDGSTYRLAQAADAGATAPAAGMWVSVVDTRTGFTVPLGTAGGQPVYTLYTDARGGFAADLDAGVRPFARVVARAPGKPDPGLTVNLLTATAEAGKDLVVDAEAAAATTFFRTIFGIRLGAIQAIDPAEAAQAFVGTGGDADALKLLFQTYGEAGLREIQGVYKEVGADRLSPALKTELHLLMADRVFAAMSLDDLTLTNDLMGDRKGAAELVGQPALPALRLVFRHIREGARAQLRGQADPVAYFAAKRYMQEYNLRQAPEDRVRIAQAEDLVAFVVRAYLAKNDTFEYELMHDILHDLYADLPAAEREGLTPQALELRDRDRLNMAGGAFTLAFLRDLFQKADDAGKPVTTLTAELIRACGAKLAAVPAPPAPAAPAAVPVPAPPPAEPAWVVTTVAGKAGETDVTDGPGADARFNKPRGLWADPAADPPVLYLADAGNCLIRKLVFDAAGACTVTTIAGVKLPDPATGKLIGAKLAQDGPPNVGCFVEPSDLALAPDGKLYVLDAGIHGLRRVNLDKGAANADVETLTNQIPMPFKDPPLADGPGKDVGFIFPTGLALEDAGHVLIADGYHYATRRVALTAPFAVTTLLGQGRSGNLDGPLAGALQDQAFDVARAPDGAIWLCEGGPSPIRRIDPDGKEVRTIAGGRLRSATSVDGACFGRAATFNHPWSLAISAEGDAIVADTLNHRIRRVRPDGWVTTIAGSGTVGQDGGGYADGDGPAAKFKVPRGVAVAPDGSIFVADDTHTIRRIRRK